MHLQTQDTIFFGLGKTNDSQDFVVLGFVDLDNEEVDIKYPMDIKYAFGNYIVSSRSYDDVYLIPPWNINDYRKSYVPFKKQLTRDDYDYLKNENIPGLIINHEEESASVNYPLTLDKAAEKEINLMISKGELLRKDYVTGAWKKTTLAEISSNTIFDVMAQLLDQTILKIDNTDEK